MLLTKIQVFCRMGASTLLCSCKRIPRWGISWSLEYSPDLAKLDLRFCGLFKGASISNITSKYATITIMKHGLVRFCNTRNSDKLNLIIDHWHLFVIGSGWNVCFPKAFKMHVYRYRLLFKILGRSPMVAPLRTS